MRHFIGIPVVLSEELAQFRANYDWRAAVVEPHITLVPPFDETYVAENFIKHIERVAQKHTKMELFATGFHITSRGHIFYVFDDKSNTFLTNLQDDLISFFDKDGEHEPFFPHIMLGNTDPAFIDEQFMEQLSYLCTQQSFLVDRLRLYKSVGLKEKRVIVRDFIFEVNKEKRA